jgi:hypothetical protein
MKKLITLSLFLIFSAFINSFAEGIVFTPERMITDFNGVVYNGINMLSYGNYGIITFSKDRGEHWDQLNIGDKYNIKKLRTLEKNFYGVTEYSIIKSVNDGIKWKNQEITDKPDIISLAVTDNTIYILTKNSVLKSDLDLKVDAQPLIEFDSSQKYIEIEEHGGSIYLLNDIDIKDSLNQKLILKYNIDNKTIEKIYLNEVKQFKSDIVHISNLKLNGNNIYYSNEIIHTEIPGMSNSNYLMKSSDGGKSWLKYYFGNCLAFLFDIGKIYHLDYINTQITLSELNDSPEPGSMAIETMITDTSSIPEREQSLSFNYLKEVIKLSKDTLIAVGRNKIISTSYDGGKKWILKSNYTDARSFLYFDISYYSINKPPVFINSDYIFNYNRYKTSNGGITWMPPFNSDTIDIKNYESDFYFYDKDGSGISTKNGSDSLYALLTNDFGETYFKNKFKIPALQTGGGGRQNPGIKVNDRLLFMNNVSTGNFSYLYVFDKDYQLINTAKIDSALIRNLVKDKKSNLYTFSISAPNGWADGKSWYYQLLRSKDYGDSWERILPNLPFESRIVDNKYYLSPIKNVFAYKNYIIMPNIYAEPTRLYLFDTETELLDSIEVPFFLSRSDEAIFSFKGDFYAISDNNTIYSTKNFGTKNAIWDSVHISKYLYDWKDYKPGSKIAGRDMIYSVWTDETQIYLVTVKSANGYMAGQFVNYFNSNLVRLFKQEPSSVDKNINIIEKMINIFPNPATDYIVIQPSEGWEPSEGSEIQIFNTLGEIVLTVEQASPSVQRIDISNLVPGIYFIKIGNRVEKFVKM